MCPSFIDQGTFDISQRIASIGNLFNQHNKKRHIFKFLSRFFSLTLPWPVSFFSYSSFPYPIPHIHAPGVEDKTCCQVGREMPKGCDRKKTRLGLGSSCRLCKCKTKQVLLLLLLLGCCSTATHFYFYFSFKT